MSTAADVINAGCDRLREVVTDPAVWCTATVLSGVVWRITRASAKVGTANAEWDKAVKFDCAKVQAESNQRGALCRERLATLRSNEAAWTK